MAAAASCASVMTIPQAWRSLRNGHGDGISRWTWYLIVTNAALSVHATRRCGPMPHMEFFVELGTFASIAGTSSGTELRTKH